MHSGGTRTSMRADQRTKRSVASTITSDHCPLSINPEREKRLWWDVNIGWIIWWIIGWMIEEWWMNEWKKNEIKRRMKWKKPVASGSNALNLSKIIALLFMIRPCKDVLFTTSIL